MDVPAGVACLCVRCICEQLDRVRGESRQQQKHIREGIGSVACKIVRSNALVQENEALVGRQQCVSSKRISRKLPYAILHRPCSQSKRRAQVQERHIDGLLHRILARVSA